MRHLELNIAFSLLLIVSACEKRDTFPSVQVMGHAGNGLANSTTFFHDNSLEAIQCGLSKPGCDGIEVDVQLSASGSLWLFHDATTKDEIGVDGCIGTLSDVDLQNSSYKTVHKEKVLRLKDLPLQLLQNRTIYLDLKHVNACNGSLADYNLVEAQLIAFRELVSNQTLVVFCQYLPWLQALKAQNFTVMTEIQSLAQYETIIAEFPQVDGIVSRNKNITEEEVSLIQSQQRKVVLFDMRSASGSRKALKKFPDALLTDDLTATLIERNL